MNFACPLLTWYNVLPGLKHHLGDPVRFIEPLVTGCLTLVHQKAKYGKYSEVILVCEL